MTEKDSILVTEDRRYKIHGDPASSRNWMVTDQETGKKYYAYFYANPGCGLTDCSVAKWLTLEPMDPEEDAKRIPIEKVRVK